MATKTKDEKALNKMMRRPPTDDDLLHATTFSLMATEQAIANSYYKRATPSAMQQLSLAADRLALTIRQRLERL